MAITKEQAVAWANSKIGQRIDMDNYAGAQCMDLVIAFCNEHFGWWPKGNAIDLASQVLPAGFQRFKNTPDFLPLPGDIFIWAHDQYGHTGIITSATLTSYTSVEQNGQAPTDGSGPARAYTRSYTNFWGVIRPPYKMSPPPFPSRACKVKVGNIVLLSAGAKITSPWSSNEAIPTNRVNQYYKVEQIHALSSKWSNSEYEVLIRSNETTYRKWIYEQDLSLAPTAKFKVGTKVRLSTGATNASIHWSRRLLEKKFLGQEYTIGQIDTTAESHSPYQYMISNPTLGNLWVLEQDLMDRTVWFITKDPFMNQGHNQNPEVKNGTMYKTIINNIPLETGAKSMAEFVRQNTWPMLTNGNVFLIEYPTHLMVKVVGVKPEWTDYMKSECLRLTKGQISNYNERDMKVVAQADKKYNWIEIDNLPKDWQAISNRLRGNLREKFCQYFLSTRVSYGKQSDGKYYLQIINIENNERATELAAKLKRWFPGDTNAYTNAQVFLQK
ncbi:CHAP domain-containing protein [Enterococcus rotai]|uniref:CHAP domain-containing protein n=1 Tax=Enterococcus rotai TaxID=118060 RepID=UPI0032B406DA